MKNTLSQTTVQALKESYLPDRFVNKIVWDCKRIFEEPIPDLMYIVLFGSCAKGTLHIGSDVDLLVLTRKEINKEIKQDLHHDLDEPLEGVSTDIVFYDLTTYLSSECLLVREVKKYGKILWRASDDREYV